MPIASTSLQRPLSRRLLPLVYGLLFVIGLILSFTWAALQLQAALAGFLNGESVWSKAQKQAVIDLDAYAARGGPADLASFRRNYEVMEIDRWARDVTAGERFDRDAVAQALSQGKTIHAAIPASPPTTIATGTPARWQAITSV